MNIFKQERLNECWGWISVVYRGERCTIHSEKVEDRRNSGPGERAVEKFRELPARDSRFARRQIFVKGNSSFYRSNVSRSSTRTSSGRYTSGCLLRYNAFRKLDRALIFQKFLRNATMSV